MASFAATYKDCNLEEASEASATGLVTLPDSCSRQLVAVACSLADWGFLGEEVPEGANAAGVACRLPEIKRRHCSHSEWVAARSLEEEAVRSCSTSESDHFSQIHVTP